MMLLAIKGLHVQPDIKKTKNMDFINLAEIEKPKNQKMKVQDVEFHLGLFNMNGDMFMSEKDVD